MRALMRVASMALMTGFLAALLTPGTASAGTLLLTDGGGGNPFGDTSGFVIDFDTAFTSWSPALVAGKTYEIESISIWEASDSHPSGPNSTPAYLAVFNSSLAFDGDTAAEYLGHSDNAINHTATPDTTKITYTFTNLFVTADSGSPLSGSGLLYFTWDDNTTRNNFGPSSGVHPFQRIDSNPSAANPAYGAAVYAFNAIQGQRVPEIEVTISAIVPEPSTLSLLGLVSLGGLVFRRRSLK